MAKHCTYYVYT